MLIIIVLKILCLLKNLLSFNEVNVFLLSIMYSVICINIISWTILNNFYSKIKYLIIEFAK